MESLTANGVTVQVSLKDLGWKLCAGVAVANVSPLYIYVNPVGVTLESAGTHWKSLANQDPAQVAREMARQQAPASGDAVNVEYKVLDSAPVFAPVVYAAHRKPVVEETSQQQAQPQAKPAVVNTANQFSVAALKKGTLRPDAKVSGAVWFERDSNPDQYVMRVPVDNQVFEFPLSLNQ